MKTAWVLLLAAIAAGDTITINQEAPAELRYTAEERTGAACTDDTLRLVVPGPGLLSVEHTGTATTAARFYWEGLRCSMAFAGAEIPRLVLFREPGELPIGMRLCAVIPPSDPADRVDLDLAWYPDTLELGADRAFRLILPQRTFPRDTVDLCLSVVTNGTLRIAGAWPVSIVGVQSTHFEDTTAYSFPVSSRGYHQARIFLYSESGAGWRELAIRWDGDGSAVSSSARGAPRRSRRDLVRRRVDLLGRVLPKLVHPQ